MRSPEVLGIRSFCHDEEAFDFQSHERRSTLADDQVRLGIPVLQGFVAWTAGAWRRETRRKSKKQFLYPKHISLCFVHLRTFSAPDATVFYFRTPKSLP
jgi:hypothetical protein